MPIKVVDVTPSGVSAIDNREKDRSYILLRVLAVAIAAGWVYLSPFPDSQKSNLYLLVGISGFLTIAFILAGLTRQEGYGRLYMLFIIPDVVLLTAFIHKAEPYGDNIAIVYSIATALTSYYYGWRTGNLVAGIMSVANLVRVSFFTIRPVYDGDLLLQLGLIWLAATMAGGVAKSVEYNRAKIEELNKELERRMAMLSSASRIILSATDFQRLVYLLRETLEHVFAVDCYCFFLIEQEKRALLARVCHGVEKSAEKVIGEILIERVDEIKASSAFNEGGEVRARVWHLPGLETYSSLVRCGNDSVGVLCLDKRFAKSFDREEMDLLITVFNQLAVSMENAFLYDQLKKTSVTDPLTHVYNRRYMQGYLSKEVKRCQRYEKELSVVMLDLDDFKAYNDTYGHLQGDVALQELADLLKGSCRSADIVARYGGEEFVIILPETSLAGALSVIGKVREMVCGHHFLGFNAKRDEGLTASFGVASFPEDGLTARELLLSADKALYLAKTSGKNKLVAYRDLQVG